MNNLENVLNKAYTIIKQNKSQKDFIISIIQEESGVTLEHKNITILKDGYIYLHILGLKRKVIFSKKDKIISKIQEKYKTIQFL